MSKFAKQTNAFKDLDEMERPKVQAAAKTQMDDTLVACGVIDPELEDMNDDEFHLRFQNEMAQIDMNDYKPIEQLEDEQVSDDILEKYRRQRLREMQEERAKSKFGDLREITDKEFETEVRAFQGVVVCCLYDPKTSSSDVMCRCLIQLAAKFPEVKFLKLIGDGRISGFDSRNCPTLMCYKKGDVLAQFVGLQAFAGLKTTADVVEWELQKEWVLESDLEEDPREADRNKFRMKTNFVKGRSTYRRGREADSDSDPYDDDDDRNSASD